MDINKLIESAAPAIGNLREFLADVVAKYPDLAPQVQPKLDALNAAASAEGLVALGKAVLDELRGLPATGIDPRFHPSD